MIEHEPEISSDQLRAARVGAEINGLRERASEYDSERWRKALYASVGLAAAVCTGVLAYRGFTDNPLITEQNAFQDWGFLGSTVITGRITIAAICDLSVSNRVVSNLHTSADTLEATNLQTAE